MRPYFTHPLATFVDDSLVPLAARASTLFPVACVFAAILVFFLFRHPSDVVSSLDLIWLAGGTLLTLMSVTLRLVYRYVGDRVPAMIWLWISLLMLVGWSFYWALPSVLFLQGAPDDVFWLMASVLLGWAVIVAELLSAFTIHALVFNTIMTGSFVLFWLLKGPLETVPTLILPLIASISLASAWLIPKRRLAILVLQHENDQLLRERDDSRQARASFLSAISNDFYQPLQAISLQLEQLPHHITTARGRELAKQMESNRFSMDRLLKSLSDLSLLDRQAINPQPVHAALTVELSEVLSRYRREAQAKGLTFSVVNQSDVVFVDTTLIGRILDYLLCNSIGYTDSGEVTVTFQTDVSGGVQLLIADTGCGIEASDLGRIFEEFGQLAKGDEPGRQGLGLGLSLAERFCDLLEIEMDFQSTPGKGTLVTLSIPAGDSEQLPVKAIASVVQSFDGLEVLLIEPDSRVRDALSSALGQWGCRVKAADSRWSGLCLLDDGWHPKLVIADNGVDDKPMALAAIVSVWQTLNEEISAIILATHTASLENETVRDAGILVLEKPVSQSDIRQAIVRLTQSSMDNEEGDTCNDSGYKPGCDSIEGDSESENAPEKAVPEKAVPEKAVPEASIVKLPEVMPEDMPPSTGSVDHPVDASTLAVVSDVDGSFVHNASATDLPANDASTEDLLPDDPSSSETPFKTSLNSNEATTNINTQESDNAGTADSKVSEDAESKISAEDATLTLVKDDR